MSALITDIRQLRRRPNKAGPVGTMPIEFGHPFEPNSPDSVSLEPDNSEKSHVSDNTSDRPSASNRIIESEPTTVHGYIVEGTTDYERVDELTAVLRRMQKAKSSLAALIETLDLEPVELIQPPGNARLWDLAGKALAPGRIYSRLQAIDAIKVGTGVSQDRAELGFKLMLESKAIEPTADATTYTAHPDQFYLGGSTPY